MIAKKKPFSFIDTAREELEKAKRKSTTTNADDKKPSTKDNLIEIEPTAEELVSKLTPK